VRHPLLPEAFVDEPSLLDLFTQLVREGSV
jgi:hypothetical protein